MFGLGGGEIVVIVLVALLVFGPQRLPEIAKGIARAYGEYQRWRDRLNNAVSDIRQEINLNLDEPLLKPDSLLPSGRQLSAKTRPPSAVKPVTQDIPVPVNDDYLSPPAYDNQSADAAPGVVDAPAAIPTGPDDYLAGGGK